MRMAYIYIFHFWAFIVLFCSIVSIYTINLVIKSFLTSFKIYFIFVQFFLKFCIWFYAYWFLQTTSQLSLLCTVIDNIVYYLHILSHHSLVLSRLTDTCADKNHMHSKYVHECQKSDGFGFPLTCNTIAFFLFLLWDKAEGGGEKERRSTSKITSACRKKWSLDKRVTIKWSKF